jgi:hypothetical protein
MSEVERQIRDEEVVVSLLGPGEMKGDGRPGLFDLTHHSRPGSLRHDFGFSST